MMLRGCKAMSRLSLFVRTGLPIAERPQGNAARRTRDPEPSGALDPHVFQRARVGEAPDQIDPRLLDARPDTPDERQFVDRDLDHAVVENALDLVDQRFALLRIRLPRLALEQIL